jgi:hypothetical protein
MPEIALKESSANCHHPRWASFLDKEEKRGLLKEANSLHHQVGGPLGGHCCSTACFSGSATLALAVHQLGRCTFGSRKS